MTKRCWGAAFTTGRTIKLILTLDVEDTGDDTVVLLPVSVVELGIVDEPRSLSEDDTPGEGNDDVVLRLLLVVSVMVGPVLDKASVALAVEEPTSVVLRLACNDGSLEEAVMPDPELA